MQSMLEQLNRTPGLLGSIIAADDGLVIARHVAHGVDPEAVAAAVSVLSQSVENLSRRCGRGEIRAFSFESDNRRVFAVRLSMGTLVAIAEGDASVGLVRTAMKQAAAAITARAPGAQPDYAEAR